MRLSDVRSPASLSAQLSLEVAQRYYSPALLNHCLRSYYFAAGAGMQRGLAFDDDLLYVAALLHDVGLTEPFDSHLVPFEEAGGHVAWVFAAGLNWPLGRRERVHEVIVRHMGDAVDPQHDTESHLLETATALDIGGSNMALWPQSFLADVVREYPRLGLADEFGVSFEEQADRKPECAAARAVRGGIRHRLASNALETIAG
ncbi:HD domain-containing protein [Kribbella sancticallisti]|uniref:HD domain-containing protein n=1 Tax=Kribbella sancticallisti TaxID=460087 RepID=A0ABP4QI85_9ACTN